MRACTQGGTRAYGRSGLAILVAVLATVCASVSAQDTVSLPDYVYDDLGFEWDLQQAGYMGDGTDDAYDGGHELYVDGSYFPSFTTATTELDGYQFVIGPATFGNIEVVRKVFISPDGAFARWIEILTNTSEVGQTVSVELYTNLGSDDYEPFTGTSTGDAAFTEDDAWIVTDDTPAGGTGDDPTVVHVMSGVGGQLPLSSVDGGQGWGSVGWGYDVYVPPLGQAAVMHYGAQRWYSDDGVEIAAALSEMTTTQGLYGITDDEAALIQNFFLSTDPFVAVVEPREGAIVGAGAADSTMGGHLGVFFANEPAATHWRWRFVETDGSFPTSGDAGGTIPPDADSDAFLAPEVDAEYSIEVAIVNDDGTMYEPLTTDTVTFYVSSPAEIAISPTSLDFGEVSVFGGDENQVDLALVTPVTGETTLAVNILDVSSDTAEFTVASYPDIIVWGETESVAVRFDPTGDGVVSANIVISHDGTNSPLTVPVTGTGTTDVSLTAYVYDALGFEWDIMGNGGISDGTSDAYDGGHQISVDGEVFPWFSYGVADGREITIGPATLGSVEVTRQVYVPQDAAFARYIDLYENTTAAAVTITISMKTNLGSNGSTTVLATSSGDTVVSAGDHWFVTDDSTDGYGGYDPVVVHVISGVDGAVAATTAAVGDPYSDNVTYDYELTLEPFEQATMLQFAVQRYAPEDAIAAAEELSALLGSATDGMTDDEIALLRNFDPDAAPSTVEASVYLHGGWTLFSLPGPSPQGTLTALGDYDVDTINGWDAAGQAYETVTDGALEHVGKGYFVHRDSTLDGVSAILEVDVDADEAASVALTIEAGWNLVGVAAGGLTPADVTDVPNTVFAWDGAGYAVASQLWPYHGYWVYNPGSAYDLTLAQLRYRSDTPKAPPLAVALEPAWETSLRVSISGGSASTLRIGSADRARAGYDAMDIAAPPVPGPRSYALLHALEDGTAGRLSRSVIPTTRGGAVWPLRASLSTAGTLTWDGIDLAQGENLRLHIDGRSYDLTRPGSAGVPSGVHDLQARFTRVAPSNTRLLANYPNPFNPETWIPFELREASDVVVRIYAVDGVLVRRLDLGHRGAGYYTTRADAAYWDGRNGMGERVASGMYLYELHAAGHSEIRRMLVLK
jgi:hypothetical protein